MKKEVYRTDGLLFSYSKKSSLAFRAGAFSVFENQSIAIVGPSGGGKSTFLRLIEGSLPVAKPQKSETALIYQDLRLVNEKTALENCLMGALGQKGLSDSEKNQRGEYLLEKLQLSTQKHQPVSMLSGGQRQRVAIARALMSQPRLLLADEPFSHLDTETAIQTYKLIKELQKELGFAWIATLHNQDIKGFQFDETWTVQSGQLLFSGEKKVEPVSAPENAAVLPRQKTGAVFAILTLIALFCLQQIPTEGFNSENATGELFRFFKKLFLHSPAELAQVNWSFLLERLLQTLEMAFLGTFFGFLISCPLGFLAADGVSFQWVSRPLRFFLMCLRSIPALIWALFFVAGLGLGVVSGIAALTVYSVGYFTKLLYEGIEDLERKPFWALQHLGASRWQAMWHALLPASKPLLISSFVFMLEYNVRSASLLGLVGAGGLGQDLMYAIEWRDYATVFSILVLLILVVLFFDQLSRWTRERIKILRGL